ncbi:minor tail protein [Gordonia phage SummitAcademy]|nr:minor tail protein [Gordonia phage SummitAcademy]
MTVPWNAPGTDVIITGWASDATEIATIAGDKLVIQGSLPAGTVILTYAYSNSDFNGATVRGTLWRNGVKVAERSDNYSNGVTSRDLRLLYHGPLVAGDQFEFRAFRSFGNSSSILADRTFMRVSQPIILRQRIIKSPKIDRSANTSVYDPMPDWTPDPLAEGAITAHKLVVSGTGQVTITAQIQTQGIGWPLTVELRKNGVAIGSVSFTTSTLVQTGRIIWTGDVVNGDQVYLVAPAGSGTWGGVIFADTTWIDLIPTIPVLQPIRVVHSADTPNGYIAANTTLTAWANDPAYQPAIILNDSEIYMQSSGTVTVTVQLDAYPTSQGPVELRKNGVTLASANFDITYSRYTRQITWTGTVTAGDRFSLANTTAMYLAPLYKDTTWITITPA